MALGSKARHCVQSVIRLRDEEVAEIISRSDRLMAANPSLSEDQAAAEAVRAILADLKGEQPAPPASEPAAPAPAEAPQAPTPFSGLGGTDSRKAVTDRISKENQDGFTALVNQAVAAGDIDRDHGDTLIGMAAQDARGMHKAKDELMRLREKASERRTQEKEAGKSWDDPDFNWSEGDPKFADLSQSARTTWTEAVAANKANGELYERLLGEYNATKNLGDTSVNDDVSTEVQAPGVKGEGATVTTALGEMKNGRDAAGWLAKNASEPWMRDIAAKIQSFLDISVPIRVIKDGNYQGVPAGPRASLRSNAFGVAYTAPDGSTSIYFRDSREVTEVDVLHELLHAATQRGLARNEDRTLRAELTTLVRTVQRTLRDIRDVTDSPTQSTNADWFQNVVDNPDELIAYGFSSPKFRQFLQRFNADGTERGPKEDYFDAAIERGANRRFRDTEAQPTLWQRIVDFVMNMVGLPKKYAPQIAKLVAQQTADKAAFLTENLTPTLMQRMDTALARALNQQADTPATTPGPEKTSEIKATPTSTDIPDFEPGNRFATTLKDWTGGWRTKPAMLGWLTLRQISDRFRNVPGVKEFAELSAQMGAKAKTLMTEAHRITQQWALLSKEDSAAMERLMLESTMEQVWPDRPLASQTHLDQENAATRTKHAALTKQYNALSEDAKRIYQQSQAKMRKDWDERGRLLTKRIVDQYRAELHHEFPGAKLDAIAQVGKRQREATTAGLSRSAARSLVSMWSDLDTHAEHLAQMQGPYFPLMRFGQHVVVAKSNDLNAATDAFVAAQERLTALNDDEGATPERIAAARKAVTAAQSAVENYKADERHYVVEFYESPSEARERQRQLVEHFAGKGEPMAVYTERREEHFGKMDAVPPSFMKRLQDTLTASLPDKDSHAIRAAVRDIYIQSMPERSALKAQLRRIGVKGVKATEMQRAFAAANMRASWHLSRLEFGQEMQEHLTALRKGETDDERVVGGEFARRLASTMQQDTSNLLIDRLSNLSYLTYLGLSPSFFVINAMQPWTISLPVMAGRFGLKQSTVELGKAFGEVAAAMKASALDQKTWRFELNLENFQNKDERAMLETLFTKGIIDVTIEHDLGSLAGGEETSQFGKVMQFASLPAHHTEVVNRVMTALAAYRLATAGGLGERATAEQATKYAENVVAETHLDYTPENAPRFMRSASLGGLGRIVFQFKKYTQGMIFLMGRMSVDALRGDREAAKGLAYLMGMQLATAGAAGLPFAAPVGMLAAAVTNMYPDDDKPEFYLMIYKGLKDVLGETAARAVMKGGFAALGMDISGRVGFGQVLNPLAFVPPNKEGADYVAAAVMALAGPAVSMSANWAQALVTAKDDPTRAAIQALPKFLSDPLRAIDRANRGVTNKRGDTLISPDEFGPLGLVMRSVGFESTDVTDMYDTRGAFLDAKHSRDTVRDRLIKQAVQARAEGESTDKVQEKIDDFNSRHEDSRITGKTVTQAAKAKMITARDLREGVAIRKNDRALAEKLGIQR